MTRRPSLVAAQLSLLLAIFGISCDRKPAVISPSTVVSPSPASSAPLATSVKVGTLGGSSASVAPGESLQLWAQASYSDDTTSDVTNAVAWQSSDPSLATITREGVLKAGTTEGAVEAIASFGKISGTLRADIRRRGCDTTSLSPSDITINAFSGSHSVGVSTPRTDCRWTVTTDSDWLRLEGGYNGSDRWRYDPGTSGSGRFSYSVLPNNLLESRRGALTVAFTDGGRIVSRVVQEGSLSCSYVVTPDEATHQRAATTSGAFDVIATPSTCRWTATVSSYNYTTITEGSSGAGNGRVKYTTSYPYSGDVAITVAGLSGANPPATYRIHFR